MSHQRCWLSLKDESSSFRDVHVLVKHFRVFALPLIFNKYNVNKFIDLIILYTLNYSGGEKIK